MFVCTKSFLASDFHACREVRESLGKMPAKKVRESQGIQIELTSGSPDYCYLSIKDAPNKGPLTDGRKPLHVT